MRPSILILALTFGLVLSACAAESNRGATGPYDALEVPTLVASGDPAALESRWAELTSSAADLETLGEGADTIAGFEAFNDPRIALTDGRFLVRGRWDADEPIAGWFQRNPDPLSEGEENPVTETVDRPVRLFVYDPLGGVLLPVSHIPGLRRFTTAVSIGESPDMVLDVVVLAGEQVVAYTAGFNGAGYDIVFGVYVAPIPPR